MTTTLAAWLHNLNPFIVRFSDDFGIRWYGLSYISGFAVAYLVITWLAKRRLIEIPRERVGDAMLTFIIGTLVGGRLLYVLVYDRTLLGFQSGFPFWKVFAINHGGMASHGGMIGVILASYRVSRGWKNPDGAIVGRTSWLHVIDITALACTSGLLFGRLANFINAELLGKVHSPPGVEGPWWTVQFPQELLTKARELTPAQTGVLNQLIATVPGKSPGDQLEYIVAHASQFATQLKPLLNSRYPSQLFQAAAEGLLLGISLLLIWARPRKPGVIGAWFLIIYGAFRILTEFWRLPDAQFMTDEFKSGRPYGLSVGQWLSVAMVVVGLAALAIVIRRPVARIGGWLRSNPAPAR